MLPIPFPKYTTYPGHSGVDFPYSSGTPVRAGGAGRIVGRGHTDRAGYYVRVAYDNGTRVLSCHFRNLGATPAMDLRIVEGSVIGAIGSTGNATGPHLHQEVDGAASTAGYWSRHDRNRVIGVGVAVGHNLTGRAVREIQRVVGASQDGAYGPDTTAKVMTWQCANGLQADGVWGQLSDAKAFGSAPPGTARATIRRGSKGVDVLAAQTRLKTAYALYAGALTLDGDFGPSTERAITEFQRRSGLTADGIVGPQTWKALGL